MKKVIPLMVISIIFVLMINSSCKKDSQLNAWQKFWHHETMVMVELNSKHKDQIIPKIDQIRTTLDPVIWDQDTIALYGPGGYTKTANKAWSIWLECFHQTLMPDTLFPSTKGELAKLIQAYLNNRRDYDKDKALRKLWLCIPKELYAQDERLWEWFLTKIHDYFTVTLGGPDAWTDGTRQMSQEMEIYHLPTTKDPNDPWHCECPGETRITAWYKNYAEGPDKKIAESAEYRQKMSMFKRQNAEQRYEKYLKSPDKDFIGPIGDYETKLVVIDNKEYYVLEIPCIPTRE